MLKLIRLLLVVVVFNGHLARGQEYLSRNFRVEEGLPTDIVKDAAQDSLGFLWLATDDGLVKFDGLTFTHFSQATTSPFCKSLLKTSDGKILVASDLDIVEITSRLDSPHFKTILRGSRNPTDSTIWYPKSIFQSGDGALWIGEPQSVVRYQNGKLTRYPFGLADRTPVFIRSFLFFENDSGELFTSSYNGNLYQFDAPSNSFNPVMQLPYGVSQLFAHDSSVWIPANDGLYKIDRELKSPVMKIIDQAEFSHLSRVDDSTLLASTYEGNLFRVNTSTGVSTTVPMSFRNINASYVSPQQDIWLSTTNGFVLLQSTQFKTLVAKGVRDFIESAVVTESGTYFCTQTTLYKSVDNATRAIHTVPQGYFQSLAAQNDFLWAANNTRLFLFKNDRLLREWDFVRSGQFIHSISVDGFGNLWAAQGNNSSIIQITPDLNQKFYPVELPEGKITNVVKSSRKGIYVGANGSGSYLFFKPHDAETFTNISAPVDFTLSGDFNVNDIAVADDAIWLASSEGLLQYKNGSLRQISLETRGGSKAIKSVFLHSKNHLLLGTTLGLLLYDTTAEEYWLFDENSGLASNVISQRGIYVDQENTLWVCTSEGLSYSVQNLIDYKKTQTPRCISALINGTPHLADTVFAIPNNGFVTLVFSSMAFPQNQVVYEWRYVGTGEGWKKMTGNALVLSALSHGKKKIAVHAKKINGYYWSDAAHLTLVVESPFWLSLQGITLLTIAVAFIVLVSYKVTATVLNRRKKYLEQLVEERTRALTLVNDELAERNSELDKFVYSASHDLSAPLKSLLGLSKVVQLESTDPVVHQYMKLMQSSIHKLESFIKDIINYSRNTRLPVEHEFIDFVPFCQALLDDHKFAPNYGDIRFELTNQATAAFYSDTTRLRIILNNLISNAIKFHMVDERSDAYIAIGLRHYESQFEIIVKDNGRGIPEEHHEKLFDMFYRATDSAQGSGLGLYIMKESVEKLGGRILLASTIDVGTTFTILLPLPKK